MTEKLRLVLLPGLMCTEAVWNPVIDRLGVDVVAHPLMHASLSSVTALADDALRRVPGRFALAAHSFGGYVALAMMRLAPERISHLILVASSARADSPEQLHGREQMIRAVKAGKFASIQPRMLPNLVEPSRLNDPALLERLSEMVTMVGAETFMTHLVAAKGRPDSYALLPHIRIPTLVACGQQDRVTLPKEQETMAAAVPGAALSMLDNCGHMTPLERPSELAAAIRSHLEV